MALLLADESRYNGLFNRLDLGTDSPFLGEGLEEELCFLQVVFSHLRSRPTVAENQRTLSLSSLSVTNCPCEVRTRGQRLFSQQVMLAFLLEYRYTFAAGACMLLYSRQPSQ